MQDKKKKTLKETLICFCFVQILSDGRTAAPLIRLGYLHALRGGKTYFTHFHHLSQDKDYPQVSYLKTKQV